MIEKAEAGRLQKTIEIDKNIRTAAECVGILSVAGALYEPFICIPAAITSGIIFQIADRQLRKNENKLNLTQLQTAKT
jgi:hypothetical protein